VGAGLGWANHRRETKRRGLLSDTLALELLGCLRLKLSVLALSS